MALQNLIEILIGRMVVAVDYIFVPATLILLLWVINELYYRAANQNAPRAIYATAWLGAPIAVVSQAAMAAITGMHLRQVKPYTRKPDSYVVGYVEYVFSILNFSHSLGRFLVALGPLLAGVMLTIILFRYAGIPQIHAYSQFQWTKISESGDYWNALTSWLPALGDMIPTAPGLIAIALACSIGLHASPSAQAVKNGLKGLLILVLGLFALMMVDLLIPVISNLYIVGALQGLHYFGLGVVQMTVLSTFAAACLTIINVSLGFIRHKLSTHTKPEHD